MIRHRIRMYFKLSQIKRKLHQTFPCFNYKHLTFPTKIFLYIRTYFEVFMHRKYSYIFQEFLGFFLHFWDFSVIFFRIFLRFLWFFCTYSMHIFGISSCILHTYFGNFMYIHIRSLVMMHDALSEWRNVGGIFQIELSLIIFTAHMIIKQLQLV